ncbi:MAG TPA: excinuclease ABC subunit UvrA, partial [Planctomycetota bacterium]|nr:excinuclease ABC subunit UvrA [Planctomycetota bacterium]
MKSIRIRGASEHNLKNVSLEIPRDVITVFTGVSGSGKSSLAFDTIYKEGQRRFLESLSAYARQFLGGFEKPRVEMIEGLSPTISIDQKTVGRSPRSTVGTITEIYDHLRLLYARLGLAHCPRCGKPVATQSAEQIAERVLDSFRGKTALACAPLVRGRKGEYRQILLDLRRDGHTRLRVDGTFVRLDDELPLLRKSERHTIEVVCDRLEVRRELAGRWTEAIEKCLDLGEGLATVVVFERGAQGAIEKEETYSSKFACPGCGVDLPEMEPRLFSFNSPLGACLTCSGVGTTEQIDPELMVLDPSLPFAKGGLWGMLTSGQFLDEELDSRGFRALGKRLGFTTRSSWGDLGHAARDALLRGTSDYVGFGPGLELACNVKGLQWLAPFFRTRPCPSCGGSRLCPAARAVKFHEKSIHEASALPAGQLSAWLSSLALEGMESIVGEPILKHVLSRLGYLERVGLSYLTLDRRSDTLAGGEAQRLRLASQVGAGLQGVLFVLDEPSIGLHPRDNRALLSTLASLRDLGNTVLVVEHDQATMEAADHMIDVGPGAGPLGGEIVAQGGIADIARAPRSVTGRYLSGKDSITIPATRRQPGAEWLEVCGVRENNLKDIDVRIPLGLLVVVTGVSGSGKSSLINRVLRPALLRKLGFMNAVPGKHRSILGYQHVDKIVDIDQSPIGRTPRSNPATYVKVFDMIRELFAAVPEARARGYTPGRFSFNKDGGRCLECEGAGIMVV